MGEALGALHTGDDKPTIKQETAVVIASTFLAVVLFEFVYLFLVIAFELPCCEYSQMCFLRESSAWGMGRP